jgi:mannan endo-1,6-alpha-mannosidase
MMTYYTGNQPGQTPGLLTDPQKMNKDGYYWWESGAMFGSLVDYWHYTGDTKYNDIVTQALLFQVGPEINYEPPAQAQSLGNDDQAFWAMSALRAAEVNFPNPPKDQPQWLALAQAVFNRQAARWDEQTCNGGLHWQIPFVNAGYWYKNTISNGAFFNIASRLALYTKNDTYAVWAERAWDWMEGVQLIAPETYYVYDGADSQFKNCSETLKIQWTYNAGIILHGAANMYNYTSSVSPSNTNPNITSKNSDAAKWQTHTQGLLKGIDLFFQINATDIMCEGACEGVPGLCNNDQRSFKAYLSRWMAASTKIAPFVTPYVTRVLRSSALAAAAQCTGGPSGTLCGSRWIDGGKYDGTKGVGQQMSALEVIQSNLVANVAGPVSAGNGGTSVGNPSAGTRVSQNVDYAPITTADRAGAGILTILSVTTFVAMAVWISIS